jgi:hypothetical protein
MTRDSKVRTMVLHALDAAKQEAQKQIHYILIRDNLHLELMERYDIGSAQHDHEWLNWNKDLFMENYKEEVYDMILYTAMNIVRTETARKYGGDSSTSYNQATLLSCEESVTEIGEFE